jgi:hypothetical protein
MTTSVENKPTAKSAARKTTKPIKKAARGKTAAAPATKSSPLKVKSKAEKKDKVKKPKLVRDSFKFPKTEYVVLDELKQRALKLAHPIKKGELLRASIKALAGMTDADFLKALKAIPTIKTGRPKRT